MDVFGSHFVMGAMSARYIRAFLATVCFLLALATSASAECAWVLWAKDNLGIAKPGFTWTSLTGFQAGEIRVGDMVTPLPAEKRCHEEANRMMRDEIKKRINKDGSETPEMTLHCLPDTVDPRGPRGK